ncbi:MAG: hypothetical protein ACO3NL_15250, partial [Phycisphaerales bacterium]
MSKNLLLKFLLIAAIAAVCLYELFPVERQIRLGDHLVGRRAFGDAHGVGEADAAAKVLAQA